MPDQTTPTGTNFYELLNLPVSFDVDNALLDQHYRKVQSEVHPDRFVASSAAEQLRSMQMATLANDAYRTLKDPTARARYLLQLNGIETLEESYTAMPAEFLMAQMEWREAIEDAQAASDIGTLDALLGEMRKASRQLQQELQRDLGQALWPQAADTVRKLSFIDKIRADAEHVIESLESKP